MRSLAAVLLSASAAFAGDFQPDAALGLEMKISLDLRGVALKDAVSIFGAATGLNFIVLDGGDRRVGLVVRDIRARSALRLLLQPLDLGAVLENGAVVIRNRRCQYGGLTHRIYDVRPMLVKLTDFPGPKLGMESDGLRGVRLGLIATRDDWGWGCPTEDFLVMVTKLHAGGRSWEENPWTSIMCIHGFLHVNQTPRVHREIEELLLMFPF